MGRARAHHDAAVGLLADGRDGERRRAAARRVDGHDDVIRVVSVRVLDLVPVDGNRLAVEEGLNIGAIVCLLRTIGADAHRFAQQHGGIVGKK